ncbi:hypothetical protein SAMN05421823_101451 [Catalinimonas alkaloidigena]|uniref:Outer membrane protein beta-barrel domain-containing protein n=2 Tax=Catalinimonas alkaloidigena TaxID=1075417 RepID=A0A1G8XRE3_9BACT|nr:hypothetical protein SAMN05421823_101451 [Catalinimonas alkaloidigena]
MMGLFAAVPHNAQAQSYAKGDNILMAGVSIGRYGYGYSWYYSNAALFLPLNAALELGVHEFISVGPYLAYARWYGWNYVSVGARGSAHLFPILNEYLDTDLDDTDIDVYVSVLLGLDFRPYYYTNDSNFRGRAGIGGGSVVGARYQFNPNVGVYAEVGRGALGYLTGGVALKF